MLAHLPPLPFHSFLHCLLLRLHFRHHLHHFEPEKRFMLRTEGSPSSESPAHASAEELAEHLLGRYFFFEHGAASLSALWSSETAESRRSVTG
jgi:hypothetical protein